MLTLLLAAWTAAGVPMHGCPPAGESLLKVVRGFLLVNPCLNM